MTKMVLFRGHVTASIYVGILKVIMSLLSLATLGLLARALGVTEFGAYVFIYTAATLIVVPVFQGLPVLVLREASKQAGSYRHLSRLISGTVGLLIGIAIFSLIVFYYLFDTSDLEITLWSVAIFACISTLIFQSYSSIIRGAGYPVLGQLAEMVVKPGVFFIFAAIIYLYGKGGAIEALICNLIASAAGVVFVIYIYKTFLINIDININNYKLIYWIKIMIPLSVVGSFQIINSQIDLIVIGALLQSSDVGVYKISSVLAMQVSFGLTAINSIVAPSFSRLYADGKIGEIFLLNKHMVKFSFVFGMAVFLLYCLFGEYFIKNIIGSEYALSYYPLIILSAAHVLTLWAGSTSTLLIMTGNERYVIYAAVSACIINLVLNLLLIPFYGIVGAAVATSISLISWRLILVFSVNSKISVEEKI